MANKDLDKKQWTDPKDYGLPFVDITPIRAKAKAVQSEASGTKRKEEVSAPVLPPVEMELPTQVEVPVRSEEKKAEKSTSTVTSNRPVENKKSSAWIWAVVLIGLGLVSVIVWQIQSQFEAVQPEVVLAEPENQVEVAAPDVAPVDVDSIAPDQTQAAVVPDSVPSSSNSTLNISKPVETGTTIATVASGNLIRIESKADRPQYFIIVGSLPNEKQASDEAKGYFGRSSTIYLISPYDEVTNYRLAIGKFGSFRAASEELEKIKSQYSEALWILKY
jgi:hypothetical protein